MKSISASVVLAVIAVLPSLSVGIRAQDQASILDASFEVASFKPHVHGGPATWRTLTTGEVTLINIPFTTLLYGAYQLQPSQLIGAPAWVREENYDIIARLDPAIASRSQPPGSVPTWALALRRLLVERAGLRFHREMRQVPIYALVKARTDGRLGQNIRPAQADCDALRRQLATTTREGKPSPYPPDTPTYTACGLRRGPGRIVAGGHGLAEFLSALSIESGRPVVDRTGLTGQWDLFVQYAPGGAAPAGDSNLPDLFTALQEQLGLRLEPATGPVSVFVIDRLERPTMN